MNRTDKPEAHVSESIRESDRADVEAHKARHVTYSYGGVEYDAVVTKVHSDDIVDLRVEGPEHNFERLSVPIARNGDHHDGRWSETIAKPRTKTR